MKRREYTEDLEGKKTLLIITDNIVYHAQSKCSKQNEGVGDGTSDCGKLIHLKLGHVPQAALLPSFIFNHPVSSVLSTSDPKTKVLSPEYQWSKYQELHAPPSELARSLGPECQWSKDQRQWNEPIFSLREKTETSKSRSSTERRRHSRKPMVPIPSWNESQSCKCSCLTSCFSYYIHLLLPLTLLTGRNVHWYNLFFF